MLVTMKEILDRAKEGNYGVTAPNVQSEDTVRAVIEVAEKCKAPMIIDVNAFIHPDLPWFVHMIRDLASQASVPIAINLDHGRSYEDIMLGIRSGFTSIMVDRSALSYEENRDQTKEVVKMCKPLGMTVEAELGHVGMGTNYEVDGVSNLTVPEEAAKFIEETGIDCLAVAVGTAHGRYKGKPHIDFERLEKIVEACGNTPLVLHGGSGTGDENLAKAVKCGIYSEAVEGDMKLLSAQPTFAQESKKIEELMAELSERALKSGVNRIVVGGGETSGAVTLKLGFHGFYIGDSIDPGVPVLYPLHNSQISLVLKSGNFGSEEFFLKSIQY